MRDINILKDSGFAIDEVMELFDNISMYDEILDEFYTETISRVKQIIKYKNIGDMTNYAILVHTMKGESQYLGIRSLAQVTLDHQLKSQANDIEYVNANFDTLMKEIMKVLDVIKIYLGK